MITNVKCGESTPFGAAEDPKMAWEEAFLGVDRITEDPEAMAMEIDEPTGKMPLGEIIGRFVSMDLLFSALEPGCTATELTRLSGSRATD